MTNRRFFLLGAAAVLATPAIVRAESLMRVVAPKLMTGREIADQHFVLLSDIEKIVRPPMILPSHVAYYDPSKVQYLLYGNINFNLKPDWIAEDWRYVTRLKEIV